MPEKKHAVSMKASSLELTKADVEFRGARDCEHFGTLFLSRGAVIWRLMAGKKSYNVGWAKFDSVMRTGTKTHGK
jgi:hypothetical protein